MRSVSGRRPASNQARIKPSNLPVKMPGPFLTSSPGAAAESGMRSDMAPDCANHSPMPGERELWGFRAAVACKINGFGVHYTEPYTCGMAGVFV